MARKKIAAGSAKKFGAVVRPIRNVVPDRLDLRDRL
jgi:hypothetical protein